MFAALAATLALAGAPSTTYVACDPALPATGELGVTHPSEVTVLPNGTIILGTLNEITLSPTPCGALLYASASSSERAKIRTLNPTIGFDNLLGLGLEVALHEANHVALNSANECLVEKTTRTEVKRLLDQYADPGHAAKVEAAATAGDAALPSQYHGC